MLILRDNSPCRNSRCAPISSSLGVRSRCVELNSRPKTDNALIRCRPRHDPDSGQIRLGVREHSGSDDRILSLRTCAGLCADLECQSPGQRRHCSVRTDEGLCARRRTGSKCRTTCTDIVCWTLTIRHTVDSATMSTFCTTRKTPSPREQIHTCVARPRPLLFTDIQLSLRVSHSIDTSVVLPDDDPHTSIVWFCTKERRRLAKPAPKGGGGSSRFGIAAS